MAITTRQQRQQRRNEALQLISSGVPPTDAASQDCEVGVQQANEPEGHRNRAE